MGVAIYGPNLPPRPGGFSEDPIMAGLGTSSSGKSSFQLYYDQLIRLKILEILKGMSGNIGDLDLNNPELEALLKGFAEQLEALQEMLGGCGCDDISSLSIEQIKDLLKELGIKMKSGKGKP